MVKREQGGSGISIPFLFFYAFVMLFLCGLLYIFMMSQEMYLLKHTLRNDLEICGNHVISDINLTGSDRELCRDRILTRFNPVRTDSCTAEEIQQIRALTTSLKEQITKTFALVDDKPSKGFLKDITGKKLALTSVVYFEPVYDVSGEITGYYKYDVSNAINQIGSLSSLQREYVERSNAKFEQSSILGSSLCLKIQFEVLLPKNILSPTEDFRTRASEQYAVVSIIK